MKSRPARFVSTFCLLVVVMGLLLSSFYFLSSASEQLQIIALDVAAVCRDTSTQWMVVFCLACNFMMLLILERWPPDRIPSPTGAGEGGRRSGEGCRGKTIFLWRDRIDSPRMRLFRTFRGGITNPKLWLVAMVLLALLRYAFRYDMASRSKQVAGLLAGVVFGKAVSIWIGSCSPVEAERENMVGLTRSAKACSSTSLPTQMIMAVLLTLLATTALWQPSTDLESQYHGVLRWSGVFATPNLYGLMMGVGLVLSFEFIILSFQKPWWVVPFFASAIVCGYGLFRSYSRGAWVGTFIGLAYLVLSFQFSVFSWIRKNLRPLAILILSLGMLAFWQLRFSEWRPIQRIVSITNPNDFSWRNRMTAWEGAIRMMAHKPLAGFGWGRAESEYGKNYLPPGLDDSTAIEMNDYFMLGISAGVPALVCFVVYIWLALGKAECREQRFLTSSPTLICRAGAIVLLIGFWFDGGLFELSVGPIFWMLMELGRAIPRQTGEKRMQKPLEPTYVRCYSKKEIQLRQAAWALGSVALLQTTVYLGTPFLPVGKATMAIARKCLIPPKETGDFDFLSTNVDWHGKELRILLEHAGLARYNREIVNWTLDEHMYRQYVLTPTIQAGRDGRMNWRRALWENFYPRIRKEADPTAAAAIVLQQLRQRVAMVSKGPATIDGMWQQKTADKEGFETLCVAALRSVCVPARLNPDQQAEFWDGTEWRIVPARVF